MSCQHCVASVTETLERIPGLSHVTVDLDSHSAAYQGVADMQIIKDAISHIGFEVED